MNEREALKPCPFCGEQLTVEAEALSLVREALQGIISADWLTWEELADPEEFVRWSKPRANHALRAIAAQAQEIAELRHEIERYVETNAKLATENERLRQALRHQDDRDGRWSGCKREQLSTAACRAQPKEPSHDPTL